MIREESEVAQLRKWLKLLEEEDPGPPGPGQYYPKLRHREHFSVAGHSSFQVSRSDRPQRDVAPGPTDYVPPVAALEPRSLLSTMVSKSHRFNAETPRAPGPAYYTPRKPAKGASFHLNMGNCWVA